MKIFIAVTAAIIALTTMFQPAPKSLLIGAYYYPWWGDRHWNHYAVSGTPLLGKYDSADPATSEKQISWAGEFGVDFLAVSWWNRDSYLDQNFKKGFLKAPNIGLVKFAILYESPNCLSKKNPIDFDDQLIYRKFVDDFDYLAATYFNHPSYLKIDGRPVVFLYVTRIFKGDFAGAVAEVRRRLAKKNINLFMVADQIWWNPPPDPEKESVRSRELAAWDALTAYNLYFPGLEKENVKNTADLAEKIKIPYGSWKKLPGTILIPGVISQYDDYKLRRNPPLYATGGGDFSKMLDTGYQLASPIGKNKQKIIMITSWNEWHEGTAIEPGGSITDDKYLWLKILKDWQTNILAEAKKPASPPGQ